MILKYNYFVSLFTLLVFSRVTSFPAAGRNKCTVLLDLYPPSFNLSDVVKICEDDVDENDNLILTYCKEIMILRYEISSCKLGGLLDNGLKATNVIKKAVNVPELNSNSICPSFTNLNSTLYHVYLDDPGFAKYLTGNLFCPVFCNQYKPNKLCEMLLRTYWIKNILLTASQEGIENKKKMPPLASNPKNLETIENKKELPPVDSNPKNPDVLKSETTEPQSTKAVVAKNKITSKSSDLEAVKKHLSPSIIVSSKKALSDKTASKPISPSSSEPNTKGETADDNQKTLIDPLLRTTIANTDVTSTLVGIPKPLTHSNLDAQSKTIADRKMEKAGDKDTETLPPKALKTNLPKENKVFDDGETENEHKPTNPDVAEKQTDKDAVANTINDKNNQPVTQMKDNKIDENNNNVDLQTSVSLEKGDNMETTLVKDSKETTLGKDSKETTLGKDTDFGNLIHDFGDGYGERIEEYQDGPQDDAQTDTKENNIDGIPKASETTLEKLDTVPQIPAFPEEEDGHFFAYFLTIVVFCIAGYLVFHNKQKIIALIVEGRHERRRRPNNGTYKRLDSKDGAKPTSHVIF